MRIGVDARHLVAGHTFLDLFGKSFKILLEQFIA